LVFLFVMADIGAKYTNKGQTTFDKPEDPQSRAKDRLNIHLLSVCEPDKIHRHRCPEKSAARHTEKPQN